MQVGVEARIYNCSVMEINDLGQSLRPFFVLTFENNLQVIEIQLGKHFLLPG